MSYKQFYKMSYKQLVVKQHAFEEAEPSMIDYAKAWSLKGQRRTWTLEDGLPRTGRVKSRNYWDDLLLMNTEKFLTYAAFCTRSSHKSDLDILTDAYEEMKTWLHHSALGNRLYDSRFLDKCSHETFQESLNMMRNHISESYNTIVRVRTKWVDGVRIIFQRFSTHQWKRLNNVSDLTSSEYEIMLSHTRGKSPDEIREFLRNKAKEIVKADRKLREWIDEGKTWKNVKTALRIDKPPMAIFQDVQDPTAFTDSLDHDGSGTTHVLAQDGWKRTMSGQGDSKWDKHKITWEYMSKQQAKPPGGLERKYEFRSLKHAQLVIYQADDMANMGFMIAPVQNEIIESKAHQKKLIKYTTLFVSGIVVAAAAAGTYVGWENVLPYPEGYNAGLRDSAVNYQHPYLLTGHTEYISVNATIDSDLTGSNLTTDYSDTKEILGLLAAPAIAMYLIGFSDAKTLEQEFLEWVNKEKSRLLLPVVRETKPFMVGMSVMIPVEDKETHRVGTIVEIEPERINVQFTNYTWKIIPNHKTEWWAIPQVYFLDNVQDEWEKSVERAAAVEKAQLNQIQVERDAVYNRFKSQPRVYPSLRRPLKTKLKRIPRLERKQ